MALPQPGIFTLGSVAHGYVELDLLAGADPAAAIATAAGLSRRETTMGGVTLVVGFRPEHWATVRPAAAVPGLSGFTTPVVGADGFTMPATQCDLVLWFAAAGYDLVFDAMIDALRRLAPYAVLVTETAGWSYHRDLDLTGFIDGTENPTLSEAPGYALVPAGALGAGGSVMLLQKWRHDTAAWTALGDAEQEKVIGRTKPDSVELDPKAETAHAARTDQDTFGHVFRRNTAYGTVSDHGTTFVGFAADRAPLQRMLASMAGVPGPDGAAPPRDALTRYSAALTGAYYFVPAVDDLLAVAPADAG